MKLNANTKQGVSRIAHILLLALLAVSATAPNAKRHRSSKKKALSNNQCAAVQGAAAAPGFTGPDSSVCKAPQVHDSVELPDVPDGEVMPPPADLTIPVHGKWCGPGHGGERWNEPMPEDAIDKVCMEHDLCYKKNHYFSCDCDLGLIDDLPEAIAATPEHAVVGGLILKHFSTTFCICRVWPLWLPGYGGLCMGPPGVGLATTFARDVIFKGIGGLIRNSWDYVEGFVATLFRPLRCKVTCNDFPDWLGGSNRRNHIKRRLKAIGNAADEATWTQEVVCLSDYLGSSSTKNSNCAECMIGNDAVNEIRSTADMMSNLVVDTGLWRHDNGCNSIAASTDEACARALHRDCSYILPIGQKEQAFGVAHQLAPDTIIYSCTAATSIHKVKRKALNAMFQAPHHDCGPATGLYCTSKAHQYCLQQHDGNYGGLIVEEIPASHQQYNELLIACFRYDYGEAHLPMETLQSFHPDCDSIWKHDTIYCRAAVANWCGAKGYKAGAILQASSALNVVGAVCWHPLLYPVSTPIAVDPQTQC